MGMGSELSAHQKLLLEMLKDFDAVCRRHGIRYQLFAGSALGAVRHNGFIPWDDDADIGILREDYEKFKKVSNELNPEICYFQNHETDPEISKQKPSCRKKASERSYRFFAS